MAKTADVEIKAPPSAGAERILTSGALEFIGGLHKDFEPRRRELLEVRKEIQAQILAGVTPGFPGDTKKIRDGEWRVASIPKDLQRRRVEITGPTDRKMVINALNSGADVYMADFEDANTPTWENMVDGQLNLFDAIRRNIDFTSPEGKAYRLNDTTATLLVRPRGWHLAERHVRAGGAPMAGGLFDFRLYVFH